jgi:beta-lactamase superfamily II metal-dependent hydrolase
LDSNDLTPNYRIVFSGDSDSETWDYIIRKYYDDVSNIDVLIAPHHGRATGGNDDYLDILKPRLSLLGNAKSEYLDYDAWNRRNLPHYTNNQAGNIILDMLYDKIRVLFSNETFAKNWDEYSYDSSLDAYYVCDV